MRLIEANAFIAEYCKNCGAGCNLDDECCLVVDTIEKAPIVDAIEVVRCHNCQHSEPCKPHKKIWCPRMGRYMKLDGFCSEGVKKDA